MNGFYLLLVGCLLTVSISADELPNWIKPCPKNDATTGDCIKDSILSVLKGGTKGYPDRKIPVLDPLFVEKAAAVSGQGSTALKQDYMDFTFSGIAQNKISHVKTNFDNNKCQIKLKSVQPTAVVKGNYAGDGRLLLFQIKGSGKFEIVLNNVELVTTVDCEFYQKDSEEYFKIKKINLAIRPQSGRLNYENLIQDNKELSTTLNQLLNDNFQDVIAEYSPALLRSIESSYTKISNQILNNIPAKYLFKD